VPQMNTPLFDLNYGLFSNVQLQFQAPVKIVQQESDRAVGLGDPLLTASLQLRLAYLLKATAKSG
jgi:hypothetical protein